jgi:hypothetical protein
MATTKKLRTRRTIKDKAQAWLKGTTSADTVKNYRGEKVEGGGYATVPELPMHRATSRQVPGYWPFVNGSAAPIIGAQLGAHFITEEPVGFDPLAWHRQGIINQPSCMVVANTGMGKSSFLRKQVLGVEAAGTHCMFLGDYKNEHAKLMKALDGFVIPVGPGAGIINILDPGNAIEAANRILAECKDEQLARSLSIKLLDDMHFRCQNLVVAVIGIFRSGIVTGHEESIIGAALAHLHDTQSDRVPILADLLQVIRDAPKSVRKIANDHGNINEYWTTVRNLENDLTGLTSGTGIGRMFNGQSSKRVPLDRPVSFDISSIASDRKDMLGAAYIACWAAGFGAINVSHALSDAHLEDPQQFYAIMDEFWLPISSGPGMVARCNAMTRLNRTEGVGMAYAIHTLLDLENMANPEDRAAAYGIVERCGAIVLGGLSRREVESVSKVYQLTDEETETLISWARMPSLDAENKRQKMPGMGKVLIKVGESNSVPVNVVFSDAEIAENVHDTNARLKNAMWEEN